MILYLICPYKILCFNWLFVLTKWYVLIEINFRTIWMSYPMTYLDNIYETNNKYNNVSHSILLIWWLGISPIIMTSFRRTLWRAGYPYTGVDHIQEQEKPIWLHYSTNNFFLLSHYIHCWYTLRKLSLLISQVKTKKVRKFTITL